MSLRAPEPTASPTLRAIDAAPLPATPQLRAATRAMPEVVELLRRRKILMAPLLVLVAFVVVGLFAPYLAPLPPTQTELGLKLTPPVWLEGGVSDRPLGTDQLGRDIGSRMIYGARLSLTTSLIGIVLSGVVGTSLGLLAGYYGAWIDALIMRVADMTLAIHLYILAIVLAVVWGPGLRNVLLVTVFLLWSRYARQARAEVLSLKEREFVVAARALGASAGRIMARHLLPNLLASLIVLSTEPLVGRDGRRRPSPDRVGVVGLDVSRRRHPARRPLGQPCRRRDPRSPGPAAPETLIAALWARLELGAYLYRKYLWPLHVSMLTNWPVAG